MESIVMMEYFNNIIHLIYLNQQLAYSHILICDVNNWIKIYFMIQTGKQLLIGFFSLVTAVLSFIPALIYKHIFS